VVPAYRECEDEGSIDWVFEQRSCEASSQHQIFEKSGHFLVALCVV